MGTRNLLLRDTVYDLKEFMVWPKRLIVCKFNKLVSMRQTQNPVLGSRIGSDVAPRPLMWKKLWSIVCHMLHDSRAKCCSRRYKCILGMCYWHDGVQNKAGDKLALWKDLILFIVLDSFLGIQHLIGDERHSQTGEELEAMVVTRAMMNQENDDSCSPWITRKWLET